ncbi:MAG: ABC transporter ATP-binding protein [Candidatus Competibacteraceae bacterium]
MAWRARLRKVYEPVRWAFGITYSTVPRLFVASGINGLVLTVIPAAIALSTRELINSVNTALAGTPLEETGAYLWLLAGFVGTLGAAIGNALNHYFARRLVIELRSRLHLDIARHHAAMPFARCEDKDYLNRLHRVQAVPELHVANLYSFSLELATKVLQILTLMAVLFAIQPLLFLLLLPIGIPFLIFHWRLVRRQFEELYRRSELERWQDYYNGLLGDGDQVAEIKLLDLSPVFIERSQRIMDDLRTLNLHYFRFEFIGNLLFVIASVIAIYVALARILGPIVAGRLTIGDLAIFGSAAAQLRWLVEQSVHLIAAVRWELLNVETVLKFFQIDPGATPAAGEPVGVLRGRIELRDVSFRYPGVAEDTLRGLSLSIEPGETVALVGTNGAGKSTVAKLIAGFYPVQRGAILFDGRDVKTLDPVQVQRQIACVFQQFGRYEVTAADTLAFGDWKRLRADQAAIEAIARRANVHDLIDAMPRGYHTQLGRRFGTYQPSGGQWQQLAIARLIARDARILILDEPTANLDVATEAELFERFRALAAGRTTLLISHRFSTVSMADRILVMEGGSIVESGSHRELMARGGRYAALFALAWRFSDDSAFAEQTSRSRGAVATAVSTAISTTS